MKLTDEEKANRLTEILDNMERKDRMQLMQSFNNSVADLIWYDQDAYIAVHATESFNISNNLDPHFQTENGWSIGQREHRRLLANFGIAERNGSR